MNIPLSDEHGINPTLSVCSRCGGEANELALAGNSIKWKCLQCGRLHIAYAGQAGRMRCPCGNTYRGGAGWEKVGKFDGTVDKIVASEPCDKCKKEIAKYKKIVADGGVYWKCSVGKSEGVVKPSDFATEVRRAHDIDPPAPCGIDFEGDTDYCLICAKS